ncbi:MAG: hypothetical protein KJO54_10205, partial [Gammaproteobacteria bacterium]|nr:hypothetical protein [Gammaproteobacteria bacterium]
MSTSPEGVPASTPATGALQKAILAGVSCLLVLAGGASARNGQHMTEAKKAQRAPAAVRPAPKVYRGADLLGVYPAHKLTVDMAKLKPKKAWRPGDAIKEIPKRSKVRPGKANPAEQAAARAQTAGSDPLIALQSRAKPGSASRAFSIPSLNFDGQGFTGANPPDTVGDVGVDYYIQMVNGGGTTVNIYNKVNGSIATSFQLESLWTDGGSCASGLGDPVVLYDRLAGRWFLSEFSSSGNRICMYVSQTGDPTAGTWYGYEIAAINFPDYPKYAVWPDAYYISSNELVPRAYAIDRAAMLNGLPATFVKFDAPSLAAFGFQALQAANTLGFQAPPAGAPGIFMRHRDDEAHNSGSANATEDYLEIFEFDVDFVTPGNSTFTGPIAIPIAEIDSELCGFTSFFCFAQPGSSTTLDPLREIVMFPLIYRNFGSHETLVGNLVTDVSGSDQGGIRWFELRKSGGGGWSVFQEGTYAPDADSRFMGSIAMDNSGNIAVGYNVTSSSTFPSLRYSGRLASDAAGTLPQGEYNIASG